MQAIQGIQILQDDSIGFKVSDQIMHMCHLIWDLAVGIFITLSTLFTKTRLNLVFIVK